MFGIICKRLQILVPKRRISVSNSISHLGFPQNPLFDVSCFQSSSFSAKVGQQKHNFTVSYLVKSCGLSLERAIFESRKLHFETPERPDLVLNLLRNHGFTTAQINKIVNTQPLLLLANPEKSLLPKLEFFGSIGLSHSESAKIITSSPSLLERSVENHLIPCYDFIKSVLITDEKVTATFKRSPRSLCQDVQKNLAPNLALLREIGVPQSSISLLLTWFPTTAFAKHSKFNETVKEVKDLGFDPGKSAFAHAIHVLSALSKENWEHKFEVYQRWGWSKDETLSAFRKHPGCMAISEEKIMEVMDFFVNKMGCPSEDISRNPTVLLYSLKKRIIPRFSVVRILLQKGLINKAWSLSTFLCPSEKCFLERYVTKFQKSVPRLLDLYQEKVDLMDKEL